MSVKSNKRKKTAGLAAFSGLAFSVFASAVFAQATAQRPGPGGLPISEGDREFQMQVRSIDRAYGRVPLLPCCTKLGDVQTINLATGTATWVAQAPTTPGSTSPTQTSLPALNATEIHPNPPSVWAAVPAAGANPPPRWIRMNAPSEGVNGLYTYTTKFAARKCAGSSGITIKGQFLADDWSVVKVNTIDVPGGVPISIPGFPLGFGFGANSLAGSINYTIPASMATGVHTITVQAYNLGAGAAGIMTNLTATQNCDVSPPRPAAHLPSWEIAGQFHPTQNPYEVWSYGYKTDPSCIGDLVPLTNTGTSPSPNTRYWLRGTNINNANDLPAVGQTQVPNTLLTPLRFSPMGLTLHPGPQNQCAVVRFTVPERGRYKMMGRFWAQNVSAPGNETDTDTMVVHTNASGATNFIDPVTRVQALSGPVTNNHFEIIGDGRVFDQGDTIDFMVGSRGNFISDSTGLHGYIERVTD
jgi:hypothetical protein